MASPDSKRTARPASELTTADIYGQRHGIPDDVQAALQNVGRRNRQCECRVLGGSLPFLLNTSHNA